MLTFTILVVVVVLLIAYRKSLKSSATATEATMNSWSAGVASEAMKDLQDVAEDWDEYLAEKKAKNADFKPISHDEFMKKIRAIDK